MTSGRMHWIKGTLLGAVLFFSSGLVFAQEQAETRRSSAQDALLEEIVITARRREERLLDQPMSIAALTGDQMQVQGIYSVDQASQFVPNVTLATAERSNNTRVVIRGIGGGFPDPVFVFGSGMYIDGHYIPTSVGGYMSTLDIERIELLRGPQGTLFGKNVMGGAVNIITTKPHDEFGASVTARVGEDGEQTIRGILNVPLSDTVFARFSAASEEFDGYYYNRNLGIDSGWKDTLAGRAQFRFVPNDNLTIDAAIGYSEKRDDNNGGQCLGPGKYNDAPQWGGGAGNVERRMYEGALQDWFATCAADFAAGHFMNSSDKYTWSNVDTETANLTATWDSGGAIGGLDNLTVTAKASYRYLEYTYFADRDYASWPIDAIGTAHPKGSNNDTKGFELIFEAQASDRLHWTAGVNWFDETALNGNNECYPLYVGSGAATDPDINVTCPSSGLHFELVPNNFTGTGRWPDGPRRNAGGPGPFAGEVSVWNESLGVFGHVTYDISDQWTLDLGARWTEDDREFHNIEFASTGCDISVDPNNMCAYTLPVNKAHLDDSGFFNQAADTFDEITPMVSLTRNLAPTDSMTNGMFYFLYSEGFLTGGFNTEVNANLPVGGPNLAYDPENVENYEVGFKGTFMDGKVQVMADVFYMDYTNQQRQIAINNADGLYGSEDPVELVQNVGASTIRGVEFELRGAFWDGGFITADFGYLKNEIDEYSFPDPENPGQIIDLSNRQLADFTPDWTLNLSVEHEFQLGNGGTLTPRLNMYAADDFDWAALEDFPTNAPESSCNQQKYAKFDGRLTYRPAEGNWHVALYGGNLTDQKIIEYCYSDRSVWLWRLNRPRWVGLEFHKSWGAE